jgi:hypothetical protein
MDKLIRGAYFHFSMTLYYSAKDFTCCKALTKGGHGMKLYYSPTSVVLVGPAVLLDKNVRDRHQHATE